MEENIKVKVKITAYEKGIIPTKVSQLDNDVPYATEQFVLDHAGSGGSSGAINGGDISNPTPSYNKIDGGVIGG